MNDLVNRLTKRLTLRYDVSSMAELWPLNGSPPGGPYKVETELPPGFPVAIIVSGSGYVAAGEFVLNGQPVSGSHPLRNGDRIGCDGEEYLFRLPVGAAPLLEACSLFFLAQTLGGLDSIQESPLLFEMVEIARVLAGMPAVELWPVPLAGEAPEWWAAGLRGESVELATEDLLVVPVIAGAKTVAMFVLRGYRGYPHAASLLTAVATLAGAGFHAGRQQRAVAIEKALLAEARPGVAAIVGESNSVRQLLAMIAKVAVKEVTVLIQGESGTGKELVARAIHAGSPRASQPFVPINCAALADSLLESELFGYEKGAFTGAVNRKPGRLELAQGGTVFLDEIGEMALGLQAKLLRVIQQREMERVGGLRPIPLDVRFVAATNRDLAAEVAAGRFREDLYHRLNVVSLRTPPLRERREDIPLLAAHFLRRASRRVSGLSPEATQALKAYDWPGNIRELENALERAVVLGEGEHIELEDLPETLLASAAFPAARLADSVEQSRREAIVTAWREADGDFRRAAAKLGIHPNSLLRLIRQLNLRPELKT